MGMTRNIHLGAILKIKLKEEIQSHTVRKCPEDVTHPSSGDFCPKCGSKIEVTIEAQKSYPDFYELDLELIDVFFEIGTSDNDDSVVFLGSNRPSDLQDEVAFDVEVTSIQRISPDQAATMVDVFKQSYKDSIKAIERHDLVLSTEVF